jgi:HK97 gp10 family phage protein
MAKDHGIRWYGERVFKLAQLQNVDAMRRACKLVESNVKTHFPKVGGGRVYKRGKIVHIASAPGQPPAIDTGTLRASIASDVKVEGMRIKGRVGVASETRAKVTYGAGTDIKYGYFLEKGTSKMKARPFLVPALRRCQTKIKRIFNKANK